MRITRKALLAAAAALALAPASASAFTGIGVGGAVTAQLVSPTFSIGTFASCTLATFGGAVTADAGAGSGGSIGFSSVTFAGCSALGSAATLTAENLPWVATMGASGGTVPVRLRLQWASLTPPCVYSGTLAYTYNVVTTVPTPPGPRHIAEYSGSLAKLSGHPFCPATVAIGARQIFDDSASAAVLP